nr:hypothetical protein CFP56_07394 [Quercus suber]
MSNFKYRTARLLSDTPEAASPGHTIDHDRTASCRALPDIPFAEHAFQRSPGEDAPPAWPKAELSGSFPESTVRCARLWSTKSQYDLSEDEPDLRIGLPLTSRPAIPSGWGIYDLLSVPHF